MTLLENGKEHLISRDEMKVMIARDHAQYIMEQRHAETQASLSSLNQCINVLRKRYHGQEETSRSQDGWSQTHHTRNDESGLNPQRDSHPTKEGCEQDGPLRHPSNEPDDRSERLSPQHSQRDLDEETLVDAVARS